MPDTTQPDFINGVVAVETQADPHALLDILHDIEAAFGRRRQHGRRWSARPLDLDLLAYDGLVLPDPAAWRRAQGDNGAVPDGLYLPHPHLHKRRFVMAPLVEIAPDWHHPVLGKAARDLLAQLPEDA